MNTQSIGGLPSGYMSFPLEIYGKSTVQGHGFELEGTLTDMESLGKAFCGDSKHSGDLETIYMSICTHTGKHNQILMIKECNTHICQTQILTGRYICYGKSTHIKPDLFEIGLNEISLCEIYCIFVAQRHGF